MIIWGGYNGTYLNTGATYDPATDTWAAISTTNAPSAKNGFNPTHTAVWTGNKMLIWGGWDGSDFHDTGAAYSPATDTWETITTINAPSGRALHGAVWTGNKMLIWGGEDESGYLNTGGALDGY